MSTFVALTVVAASVFACCPPKPTPSPPREEKKQAKPPLPNLLERDPGLAKAIQYTYNRSTSLNLTSASSLISRWSEKVRQAGETQKSTNCQTQAQVLKMRESGLLRMIEKQSQKQLRIATKIIDRIHGVLKSDTRNYSKVELGKMLAPVLPDCADKELIAQKIYAQLG